MEQDRIEMRFCGFGGQGVVLGSVIYATALAKEGYNVVQSQVYGIEARGGASSGEAMYSDKPIHHLHVTQPDILLAMSQKALDKFIDTVNPAASFFAIPSISTSSLNGQTSRYIRLP